MMEDPRKEPNPLQEIMTQFAEIINQLYDKNNKGSSGEVSEEIKIRVEYMQQMNVLLDNLYRQALVKTGITEEELKKQLKAGMKDLDPKSKEYIDKIEKMKRDVERMRVFYKEKIDLLKKQESPGSSTTSKSKEGEFKNRDNLQVGMKRGWKKL
jgi:hypothetical protein